MTTDPTEYAFYNPNTPSPSPVLGVYNPARLPPGAAPPDSKLLIAIDEDTAKAIYAGETYAVVAGAVVPHTPIAPPLTLAQQAAQAMTAGLTIALTGSLTLAPTLFPIDAMTIQKIGSVISGLNTTNGIFLNGTSTELMKDASNPPKWHTFNAAQYTAVATAIGAYVRQLDLIIDGNPLNVTALPSNSVTLTV
jgi:hypothetical protein